MTARAEDSASPVDARDLERRKTHPEKQKSVVGPAGRLHDPTICPRCGSVYHKRMWRRTNRISSALMARVEWACCPACVRANRNEACGRLLISGDYVVHHLGVIRRQVEEVARQAGPLSRGRRSVAMNWDGSNSTLEVVTASHKLAHRIAGKLEKSFGGHAVYSWSDRDGALLAIWKHECSAA